MRGKAVLLALCAALLIPCAASAAQEGAGAMTQDLLDALTKSPAAQSRPGGSFGSQGGSARGASGPVAPTPPKAPSVSAPNVPGAQTPSVPGAPSAASPNASSPKIDPRRVLSIRHDGLERHALLTFPKLLPRKRGQGAPKVPVVIFLHGAGGSAIQAMRQTNLAGRAAAAGFLAVFPEGTAAPGKESAGLTWNAWDCCGYARDKRIDDVGYLSELIGRLREEYNADPARIYVAGFSNGAELASRFALERPGAAAAIASVSGSMPCGAPRPAENLPVLVIHGARDAMARFNPTPRHPATGKLCEDHQAQAQVEHWVRGMNLSHSPRVRDDASVRVEDYGPAKSGGRGLLRYVVVKQGGHAWPGGAAERYQYCDPPTKTPDATALVLGFFLHPPRTGDAPAKATPAKPKNAAKRKSAR